jgi:hypothetical protein
MNLTILKIRLSMTNLGCFVVYIDVIGINLDSYIYILTLSHIIHVHAFIALIKGDNTVTYNTCTCFHCFN